MYVSTAFSIVLWALLITAPTVAVSIGLMAVSLYPRSTKLKGGYTGFRLSVCPSVRLSVCPSVDTTPLPLSRVQFFSDRGQTW